MANPPRLLDQGDVEIVEVQPPAPGYLDFLPPVVKETAKEVAKYATVIFAISTIYSYLYKKPFKGSYFVFTCSFISYKTIEFVLNKIFGKMAPEVMPTIEPANTDGMSIYERNLVEAEEHFRNQLPINQLTQRKLQIIRHVDIASIKEDGSLKASAFMSLPLIIDTLVRPILQQLGNFYLTFFILTKIPLAPFAIQTMSSWKSSLTKWPIIFQIIEYFSIALDDKFKAALKDKREFYQHYQPLRRQKDELEVFFTENPEPPEVEEEEEVKEEEERLEVGARNQWFENIQNLAAANLRLQALEEALPQEAREQLA